MRYFIVAYNYSGEKLIPIFHWEDDEECDYLEEFESYEEAEKYAEQVPLCQANGYEIIEL